MYRERRAARTLRKSISLGRCPPGKLTQNGLFFDAATGAKLGQAAPESVRVYEKTRNGVWYTLDCSISSMRGKKIAVGGKSSNSTCPEC